MNNLRRSQLEKERLRLARAVTLQKVVLLDDALKEFAFHFNAVKNLSNECWRMLIRDPARLRALLAALENDGPQIRGLAESLGTLVPPPSWA